MKQSQQRTIRDSVGADAWNKMQRDARSKFPVQSDDHLVSHTVHGTIRELIPDVVGGGGPTTPFVGVDFDGGWVNTKTYPAKMIVFRTPPGGSAGTYISLLSVPIDTAPETGAPYWAAFPYPPAGMWG